MRRNTNQPTDLSLADLDDKGFIIAIRQGLSELDRGESIPIEDVERELSCWVIE